MNTTTNIEESLGMKRAQHLAAALRAMGHEVEAFVLYGDRCAVGVDRVQYFTAGTWRQIVCFTPDGTLIPPAGGPAYGDGNAWRYGAEHDAVVAACKATFAEAVAA